MFEACAVMKAFVGADRNGAFDAAKNFIAIRRKRLLHERNLGFGAGAQIFREIIFIPAFVGVHDQHRIRRCSA